MVNANGCEQTLLRTVTVDALPEVNFAASPALCDAPTVFTDLSSPGSGASIVSWLWNFGDTASGDMNTSELQSPTHLFPMIDSSYVVTLVVTNSLGCTDSLVQVVEKGICLNAQFEPVSDTACRLTEVCFSDSSYILGDAYPIQLWHWDFGDGQQMEYNAFTPEVCHTYSVRGTFNVSLIVSATVEGRYYADTMLRQVSVSALPAAELGVQSPCAGDRASFFDLSQDNGVEITAWAWDFGDPFFANDTSSLQNPSYVYSQTGTYRVQLITTNANGCSDTATTDIEVFNSPLAAFSSSLACVGGLTLFTDESTQADAQISSWLWRFDDGQTSGQQHPHHVFADTGIYLVQMVVTDENLCRDTATESLSVFPVPLSAFSITDGYEEVQGQVLLDNLSQDAVRYLWHFGNGDSSEMFSPVVRYEDNGTYLIQLIAWNDNNCPDTAYMEYTIVFQGLYVPTGFTPGSRNELLSEFKPVGLNLEFYELTVINQRGNIVFRSRKLDEKGSPVEGWDGTTNGEPQPTGTYMWTISAKFKDGSVWEGNDVGDGNSKTFGKVILIR